MTGKLTAIVLTKNEEKNIYDCLESVLWCDEIIIVDDFSEDRTLEVAKSINEEKIKIFQHKLEGDFSSQRNFGLDKAESEWVLFLDADERVSQDLRAEINDVIIDETSKPKNSGYSIKRIDYMWGKELKHGETGDIKLLRLGRKKKGKWIGQVHETWQMEGKLGELNESLIHFPHQSIREFLSEINFYTDLRAKELYRNGKICKTRDIIFYPLGKFVKNYFVKLGFLDGLEGLIFALMMSFHSFLVRSKLWTISRH